MGEGESVDEIRSYCRSRLESLEHWLRSLAHELLTPVYGDLSTAVDSDGQHLFNKETREKAEGRIKRNPGRYIRYVDALLLDELISLICKEKYYKCYFKLALSAAFPQGLDMARAIMSRLVQPRNKLAHANPISAREAEQVICYSGDIIDSIKQFYRVKGMSEEYNVPKIIKITDSFGNSLFRDQLSMIHDGGISKSYVKDPRYYLRPGDIITFDIEIDASFSRKEYDILWASSKGISTNYIETRLELSITNRHVSQNLDIQCRVTSKKDWHRMSMGCDDFFMAYFKVLPPI